MIFPFSGDVKEVSCVLSGAAAWNKQLRTCSPIVVDSDFLFSDHAVHVQGKEEGTTRQNCV